MAITEPWPCPQCGGTLGCVCVDASYVSNYSIPAQCQQPVSDIHEGPVTVSGKCIVTGYSINGQHINLVKPLEFGEGDEIRLQIPKRYVDGGTLAEYGFPQSSGIPSTARAILDLVPERKVPLTPKQEAQAEGVARAVQNLSRHETRLGASRFQP